MPKAISDTVTHAEMQDELRRLRSAVVLLANACGAHIIGQHVAKELERLLAEPGERE
jgi:hypothetical protein